MNEQPQPAADYQLPSVASPSHGWRLWFSRHNWPTWLGLCFILPLVLYYWQHYNAHLQLQQRTVFQQSADNIEEELQQRLKHIELLLGANAAYISSSEYVSQAEWQHYVESLQLPRMYPGIQALGVVSYRRAAELPVLLGQLTQELQRRQRSEQQSAAENTVPPPLSVEVHPAGERPHYAIISHIQPATVQNSKVLGYDIFTDPLRTQTAMRAASLNQAAITPKVSLQQDSDRVMQPGLVMMLPLYQHNMPLLTAEQKQQALRGFVYAAFRVADILPAAWRDLNAVLPDIQWSSGQGADGRQLLFARSSTATIPSVGIFQRQPLALQQQRHLDWYGQPFVLHLTTNPLFEREALPAAEYELVFLGSVALLLLFLLLSYLNVRRYQAEYHSRQLQQHVQQQRQRLVMDEQRQSLALKASQLAWFEFDLRSGAAFYADSWWRMFDFAIQQPNPEPQQLFDVLHPSALALFRQDLQRLLAHGPDQDQQHYRFVSRQGRQLYCLVHFYVVRSAEGDAIRLCCTVQDQTILQQQSEQRQQLALLCQLEVGLAWVQRTTLARTADDELFLQQHSNWLLQFYCEALADTETGQQKHSAPRQFQHVVQLIGSVVKLYQPQVSARGLQLLWQPQSINELCTLDRHRGWQITSGLLELACALAKPGSVVALELQPFQSRLILCLQLQLSETTAEQCTAELQTQPALVNTLLQQRLIAAKFWASQLAGEFSVQQSQAPSPQLSLQLVFAAAG